MVKNNIKYLKALAHIENYSFELIENNDKEWKTYSEFFNSYFNKLSEGERSKVLYYATLFKYNNY